MVENGGGIFSERVENLHVYDDNLFEGNKANLKGGGIYTVNNILVQIQNSLFFSNEAEFTGGAIFSSNSLEFILESVVAENNSANYSGGFAAFILNNFVKIFNYTCLKNNQVRI